MDATIPNEVHHITAHLLKPFSDFLSVFSSVHCNFYLIFTACGYIFMTGTETGSAEWWPFLGVLDIILHLLRQFSYFSKH